MKKISSLLVILFFALVFSEASEKVALSTRTVSDPCMGSSQFEKSWLDRAQTYLSAKVCKPAVWFDNFFANDRIDEEDPPGSSLKVQNQFRVQQRTESEYRIKVRANVKLPKAKGRLRLIVEGENEDDRSGIENGDADGPNFDNETEDGRANVGLRVSAREKKRSSLKFTGGTKWKIPLDPFVKTRYRYTYPISNFSLARFTGTGFWRDSKGFGQVLRLDLERQLEEETLLRFSTEEDRNESSLNGYNWRSDLVLYHRTTSRNAVSVGYGIDGVTKPDFILTQSKTWASLRRQLHRDWLFFEIQPEIFWPRDIAKKRHTTHAITFKFDIHFGNI